MDEKSKMSAFVDEFGGAIVSEAAQAAQTAESENTKSVDGENENAENTPSAACACRQCRMKSWAMWVSVLGLLGMILQHTGVFAKLGLDSETWDMIITLVGSVLTAFGIVNNPTEKKKL